MLIGGSLEELARLTGWYGRRVLYVGDHLHADLREPRRIAGWSTVSDVGSSIQVACGCLLVADGALPTLPGGDRP